MIDFPTFLQGLVLVLAILIGYTLVRYFRSTEISSKMDQENRAIFLLLGLGVLAIVTLMLIIRISDWQGNMQKAQQQHRLQLELNVDEYAYIDKLYQPLAASYRQLKANVEGIMVLERRIAELQPQHPNHKQLLDEMLKIFSHERNAQQQLYHTINLEIRSAIRQSDTQNPAYIEKAFYEKAKLLHMDAIILQDSLKKRFSATASLLEDSLNQAKKNLQRSSKQRIAGLPNYAFSPATSERIYRFLEGEDAELAAMAAQIIQEITTARQKKDHMALLSQQDMELQKPLQKTQQLWSDAQAEAENYWWDICYAAEAALIAKQFNMPSRNPAYRTLFRTLKQETSEDLVLIKRRMLSVTQSYQEF